MSTGVVYIATGQKFLEEACRAVESLKQHNPNLPVTLFCDQEAVGSFDRTIHIKNPHYSFLDKPLCIQHSPYRRTLFLDTDTHICGDISELFSFLDRFDMALAHAPYRQIYPVAGVPETFPEFNTGVIVFKQSWKVKRLFRQWAAFYQRDLKKPEPPQHDQPALREAVWKSSLKLATLTPEYNCRFIFNGFVSGEVKILHGRASDLKTIASEINRHDRPRVYLPNQGSGVKLLP